MGTRAPTGLRLEVELLLCCARVHPETKTQERIRCLVRREIAWNDLILLAQMHGLMPLLYWQLSRICPDAVPELVLESLGAQFRHHAAHNLFLAGQLLKILRLFQAEGIHGIPFKGPTLATLAHGNLFLRSFGDLDLLLRPCDMPRARKLLLAEGFELAYGFSHDEADAHLQSTGQLPIWSDNSQTLVELHEQLMSAEIFFPLHFEDVQENLTSTSVAGQEVKTFCPEVMLVFLCAHGAKHGWYSLAGVCDIAELLHAHAGLDWEKVLKWAARLRSRRLLWIGLLLANTALGTPLPEVVNRAIRADPVARSLAARVCQRLCHYPGRQPTSLESTLFSLWSRDRLRDGLRYALAIAFGPTAADRKAVSLPKFAGCAYYLIRLARLTSKYGAKQFQRLRRA